MTDAKKEKPNIHLKSEAKREVSRDHARKQINNDLAVTVKLLITSFTRAIDVVHLPLETPSTAS
jgi:hypothetical protein